MGRSGRKEDRQRKRQTQRKKARLNEIEREKKDER